jgi:hypothetical protein
MVIARPSRLKIELIKAKKNLLSKYGHWDSFIAKKEKKTN